MKMSGFPDNQELASQLDPFCEQCCINLRKRTVRQVEHVRESVSRIWLGIDKCEHEENHPDCEIRVTNGLNELECVITDAVALAARVV